jgi:hypothetical protein
MDDCAENAWIMVSISQEIRPSWRPM